MVISEIDGPASSYVLAATDIDYPLTYKWAAGDERGPLFVSPYIGMAFNTKNTGLVNQAFFRLWIDQVEIDYDDYLFLLSATGYGA